MTKKIRMTVNVQISLLKFSPVISSLTSALLLLFNLRTKQITVVVSSTVRIKYRTTKLRFRPLKKEPHYPSIPGLKKLQSKIVTTR